MRKRNLLLPAFALAITAGTAVAQDNPTTSQDSSQIRSARAPEFRCALRDRSMPDPNRTVRMDPSRPRTDSARIRRDTMLGRHDGHQLGQTLGQSWTDRRLCQALEGITLSDAQQRQIDAVRERHFTMLSAILSDSGITVEQRAALDAQDTQVRAQLTPEQQTLWDRNVARLNANITTTSLRRE